MLFHHLVHIFVSLYCRKKGTCNKYKVFYTYVYPEVSISYILCLPIYRNGVSNEMVTSLSINMGIDSCYDVVRHENIADFSLNQNIPPTPFNEDKTVCTYIAYGNNDMSHI